MSEHISSQVLPRAANYRDYLQLCKPKVVLVMLITAVVGMLMASAPRPDWARLLLALLGIGLSAGAAAAINHVVDARLDALMGRTCNRPLPQGRIAAQQALGFAAVLGVAGISILAFWVNPLTAWLTLLSLLGYALVYTVYLKRATPQNIVIGGVAGAAPPLLGWVSVTNSIDPQGLMLMMIIFVWTPPHFWALCLHKKQEYAKAGVPMLPVTHGEAFTRLQVLLYSLLLCVVTWLPYLSGMCGLIYLIGAQLLNARFLMWALRLYRAEKGANLATFLFSIKYIMWLFVLLLVDHYSVLVGG